MALIRSEHVGLLNEYSPKVADFLQVLVTEFELATDRSGTTLHLRFHRNGPAIHDVAGKDAVRKFIGPARPRAPAYQGAIDACLAGVSSTFRFADTDFPFRFANGGVLPIARLGGEDYYVCFFRDIFPIGWNIANGGSKSIDELLQPGAVIDREFREELLIANPTARRFYRFPHKRDAGDEGSLPDAHRLWLKKLGMRKTKTEELPMKWIEGPDSVCVSIGDREPVCSTGYFLNLNAEDFGIEVDRVARMRLEDDVVLLDVELDHGDLLNRTVGLFQTQRTNQVVRSGETRFLPDRFFFDGQPFEGHEFEPIFNGRILPQIQARSVGQQIEELKRQPQPPNLCPVTRRIISRHMDWEAGAVPTTMAPAGVVGERRPYDVFLSFKSEDEDLASRVYDYFQAQNLSVFFSQESLPFAARGDFSNAINEALQEAKCLVVVGTRLEHLQARWVRYEYSSFHINILDGDKPQGRIFPLIAGFHAKELPLPLRTYQAVVCDAQRPRPAIKQLHALVSSALDPGA